MQLNYKTSTLRLNTAKLLSTTFSDSHRKIYVDEQNHIFCKNFVSQKHENLSAQFPTFITLTISFTSILPELSVSYILNAHLKNKVIGTVEKDMMIIHIR